MYVRNGWRLGDCRLLDYLFDTSATLSDAFAVVLDYAALVNSAGVNEGAFTDHGGSGTLRYQVRHPDPGASTIALLDQEGTSWRSEVDAMRREQAARLRQAGATSAQAATRLGYSDTRSLRRAARRWQRS